MLMQIVAAALVTGSTVQDTDTTFAVDPRLRLDVSNYSGEIVLRTWSRNEIRLRADHSRRDRIVVDHTSSEIRIRAASWREWADQFEIDIEREHVGVHIESPRYPSIINYELTVPESMNLELGGPYTDVTVEGTQGEVFIMVREGDVTVLGGAGRVSVRSVEGEVRLEGSQGNVRVLAMDGDIYILDAAGELAVETTDGDVILERVQARNVEVVSVDGDIEFTGTVQPQGLYLFSTHDGDVTVGIPEDASARVTIATFDGEFSSDFPITIPERIRGRRLNFTLGAGDAQIEIEAFDGDIDLIRFTPVRRR
ncbi:MAG: DUF4097 family beta strand repeat protein [Gemmatimonadales bacterium]|nr:DUF4097 family beta strand repeat protein [Gemmatimonadales bacterium]NIN11908.1 DUF4097 family beta strand repeat protein [Gemmatimonadales bacterium]NIN50458.1 DUF4097 family beta strand repeat protein [Gemmatimonadales bacterium]NIP07922.1 DUF4097 family beta strand repeat protein [Gemmatimonadales bacterium]NIR01946.1 DUF4097 family beta strand repeat protein [Gemmatimonadales bacterium]